jgi:ABC-2 type transport system permease protein
VNTQSNAVPGSPLDSSAVPPAAMSETRPLYWSVRRELWENRSIYIAPLAAAAVAMLAFLISVIGLRQMRELAPLDPAHQPGDLVQPYGHAAWLIMVTALIVGVFYSLDALHSERRDRSILFWKSALFRLGLATDLIATACHIAVTALFYDLFKPVEQEPFFTRGVLQPRGMRHFGFR